MEWRDKKSIENVKGCQKLPDIISKGISQPPSVCFFSLSNICDFPIRLRTGLMQPKTRQTFSVHPNCFACVELEMPHGYVFISGSILIRLLYARCSFAYFAIENRFFLNSFISFQIRLCRVYFMYIEHSDSNISCLKLNF